MKIRAYLVKAFSVDPTQGNPAGVILNADHLNENQMLSIASKIGFSESAFVSKSDKADFKLRFFTPKKEVDLCGHATIATFSVLNKLGLLKSQTSSQETKVGVLPIEVKSDGMIVMTQVEPEFGFIEDDRGKIAHLMSIPESEILETPIQSVSTGSYKLMIQISSLKTLKNIQPKLEEISQYCKVRGTNGFYPFTKETLNTDSDFHARQFNPLAGINEDPITGVAAGALGAFSKKYELTDHSDLIIEQGYFMNKGGLIHVNTERRIEAGGYAVIYDELELDTK
jgi:PhzF family phenazine biosynthesis protein